MSALSRDAVRHLARLARLDLSPAELDALTPQLDAIVGYVQRLDEVDVAGVEPLAHALDAADAFRDDEPTPSLPTEQALANAPARRGPLFAVPAALE